MSDKFDIDLAELPDWEDVRLDTPDDYQDQTGPAPLPPGIYRFRVEQAGLRKNADGQLIEDEGYPQIQLSRLVVVEPEEYAGREVFPFQSFSLKPVKSGPRMGTVPLVDLLRAFDDTVTFANGREALQRLAEFVANGATFVAGTDWEAKDSDYIRETLDEYGGLSQMDADARRALFKQAIIRGQKRFPKRNGYYVPEVEGPSGAILQARAKLTRLYPSSKVVRKMGPKNAEAAHAS